MTSRLIRLVASAVSGGPRGARDPALFALGAAAHSTAHQLSSRTPPLPAQFTLPVGPKARKYSASAFACTDGNTSKGPATTPKSAKRSKHIISVQLRGEGEPFLLDAPGSKHVGYLIDGMKRKLPSLRKVDANKIVLFLAVKDAAGAERLVKLDIVDTLDEALEKALGRPPTPEDDLDMIADVAASAAPLNLTSFSNVLTTPGECAALEAHAAALAALASPDVSPRGRLAALSEVATAVAAVNRGGMGAEFSPPLLETAFHVDFVTELVTRARKLAAGWYVDDNGSACRTVIGARGIGKTTTLLAFTYACRAAFPSIIPLYVQGQGGSLNNCFASADLESLMVATARAHGVEVVLDPRGNASKALANALRGAGRQMFVIVDEVDELYRVDGDKEPAIHRNVMRTLDLLRHLGDQKSGLFSVLLCGSSVATYGLICGDCAPAYHKKFPVLKGAVPDLNGTKFRGLSIPSVSCNDSKQVLGIVKSLNVWPDATDSERFRNARILTFIGGTAPRELKSALDGFTPSGVSARHILQLINDQLLRGRRKLSGEDNHAVDAFFQVALRLLQAENSRLIKRLRAADGSCKMEELVREHDEALLLGDDTAAREAAVPTASDGLLLDASALTPASDDDVAVAVTLAAAPEPWERLVCPVALADVEREWRQVAKAHQRPEGSGHVEWMLGVLCDASLLSVRYDDHAPGLSVWPASAAQLVYGCKGPITVAMVENLGRGLRPITHIAKAA